MHRDAGDRARMTVPAAAIGAVGALLLAAPAGAHIRPGTVETGIASWYGNGFHGRPTASGETFDMGDRTVAHRELPFGTRVRITNLRNGRSVEARVNDRGPFVHGRIVDVSASLARALGFAKRGLARVRIEVLELPGAEIVRALDARPCVPGLAPRKPVAVPEREPQVAARQWRRVVHASVAGPLGEPHPPKR